MLPATSGRVAAPITMVIEREITLQDLHRLISAPITVTAPPVIQKLTARHHACARLLAAGKSAIAVAALSNYTPQRIRDLQKDPAFKELVATYQSQFSEAEMGDEIRIREKARNLAEMAIDEMTERLEDDDKRGRIPFVSLVQVAGDQLDRTVLPKKSAQPQINTPTQITFNIAGNGNVREQKQLEPPTIDQGDNHGNSGNNSG